ncbi:GspH/FimT family pseudopilin [Marinospirillum perlucidum]|uniref:GspH/FimT family pseudopilin n=1 Tax=Marinospirillum perlucidum TaxID=1982602 RepID=UPI000DF11FF1|nr:hypothetical protein [Marinospirillum perlucidum]
MLKISQREGGSINLIDLLAALLIISSLLGVALPGYQQLSESQRQAAAINRLKGILSFARSTASLRQEEVRLCPAQDAKQCSSSTVAKNLLLVVDSTNQPLAFFQGLDLPTAFPDHDLTLVPLPHRSSGGTLLPCSGFSEVAARGVTFSTVGRIRVREDPPASLVNTCPP